MKHALPSRSAMNVHDFQKLKDEGRKISMVTCHVACGALVFATTIVLTLRVFKVLPAPVHKFELGTRAQES